MITYNRRCCLYDYYNKTWLSKKCHLPQRTQSFWYWLSILCVFCV